MACKACTEIPPVASDYTPKGTYDVLSALPGSELKTYVTGPATATRALIGIYDIFGLHPSTLQGADRLVSHLPDTLVIVPDFFKGETANLADFPPDSPDKMQRLGAFIAGPANFEKNAPVLLALAEEAKKKYPGVKAWGTYGLCWGGKLSALTAREGTPFKVAGTAHPGVPAVDEAEKIAVPFICLFSPQDGDKDVLDAYGAALRKNPQNYVETYEDMHHGWMGARANLKDEKNVQEYERGYAKLAEFYAEHLE